MFFVSETCLLKDALRCLKQLSLYLQSQEANILTAAQHIGDTVTKLQALKEIKLPEIDDEHELNASVENDGSSDGPCTDEDNKPSVCDGAKVANNNSDGNAEPEQGVKNEKGNITTLSKFWLSFENDHRFKGVEIIRKDADVSNFEKLRGQFLQSLCDNLLQRFPTSEFLEAASSLDVSVWPKNPLERALFGEKHVATLCKSFGIASAEAADVILEFAMFKKSDGVVQGSKLKHLIAVLKVLPISSADCERGFSQMNLYHTSGRNRLAVSSVNDMLMIGINGPPLTAWNAEKYVVSWLKMGRHGALDKPTGLAKKVEVVSHCSKLFA